MDDHQQALIQENLALKDAITAKDVEIKSKIIFNDFMCKVLKTIGKDSEVTFYTKPTSSYMSIGEDAELIFAHNNSLESLSIFFEDNFRKTYDHNTSFVIEKDSIVEVLKFLDAFTKDMVYNIIKIEVKNDNELNIMYDSSSISVNRNVNMKELSNTLVGKTFKVHKDYLKLAIDSIEDDFIRIKLDEYLEGEEGFKPAIDIIGESKIDAHVVLAKFVIKKINR